MAWVQGAPVCVITLTYVAPIEAVDALMKAHVAWLEQGFAENVLILAGRQVPRVGGIVLCRGQQTEVEAYAATDPFVVEGVATAGVVELAASFASDGLAADLG